MENSQRGEMPDGCRSLTIFHAFVTPSLRHQRRLVRIQPRNLFARSDAVGNFWSAYTSRYKFISAKSSKIDDRNGMRDFVARSNAEIKDDETASVCEKIQLDNLQSPFVKYIWPIFGYRGAGNRQEDTKISWERRIQFRRSRLVLEKIELEYVSEELSTRVRVEFPNTISWKTRL